MQLKLKYENVKEEYEKEKARIREEEIEKEKRREEMEKEREERKKEFEKYELGSTDVIVHDGKFYFYGDIIHCGEEAIFHNARVIKEEMIRRNSKHGGMNYNDPPTFSSPITWEEWNKEREGYKENLYLLCHHQRIIIEKIGGD